MAESDDRAGKLLEAWARRPSGAAAVALRRFYGRHVQSLPLHRRAELCIALGEAAEAEDRYEIARYLYGSAVTAVDPRRDERTYARAAMRALLNASRTGDRATLLGVGRLVERLPGREATPRLLLIGAFAKGLELFLREDWDGARRAFERAMGAAWESREADGEALAHHLLAQTWGRLGRVARVGEHVAAARRAAARAGSWLLERRLELEEIVLGLMARPSAEGLAAARRYLEGVRRRGFRRLESLGWMKLARCLPSDGASTRAFLSRSEELLPEGHPDRAFVRSIRSAAGRGSPIGLRADPRVAREIDALVRLSRA
jgi:tetratricopeptide (TPR) repeat protein